MAESIEETSTKFSKEHLASLSFSSWETGLLFGNVQAGKTAQVFGLACSAANYGFPLFLLLTTDNVTLQKQTLARVKRDLEPCGFSICDETDRQKFIENNLKSPSFIVLKKNGSVLRQWYNTMAASGFVKGNAVFIIDDEGDAASLNTLVNSDRFSTINRRLSALMDTSLAGIYLQVTGTPEAILLQSMISEFRPSFTCTFKPGKGYLGGDFFFRTPTPPSIRFIDSESGKTVDEGEDGLYVALLHHLTASAQIMLSGGDVCNFVIHPGVRKSSHASAKCKIIDAKKKCRDGIRTGQFEKDLKEEYRKTNPKESAERPFNEILEQAEKLVTEDDVRIITMNGDNDTDSSKYEKGFNIIIGGNILGRGVTFPKLQTLYYTRTAKRPQADTMWQHSRMFGYDRDPGMMAVFITGILYRLFTEINITNDSIVTQMEKGLDTIQIKFPKGLAPTRKNVLDKKRIGFLVGNVHYFPGNPGNKDIGKLDRILLGFKEREFAQVGVNLLLEILDGIIPSEDFDQKGIIDALHTVVAENPFAQGILIVRTDRDVAQGTGTLLSPNDRKLGDFFHEEMVLTMYKLTGKKGWQVPGLWVPDVKLAGDCYYYTVE